MQKITVCGVAYKVEDGETRIFLAKRSNNKKFLPGKFELIGGHVEVSDKSLEEALKREFKEELHSDIIVEEMADGFLYFNESKASQSVEVIYLVKFLDESQIKISSQDHSTFVWVNESELDILITDKNDLEYLAIKRVFLSKI